MSGHIYRPMLAKDAPGAFSDKDWVFEIKWDGFRAISYINQSLSVKSRNEKELKYNFPELEELTHLARNIVVDGEIVVMREGKTRLPSVAGARQSSFTERNRAATGTGTSNLHRF